MAKSIFDIASKSIDDQTVKIAGAVEIGRCIGYDNAAISVVGDRPRGVTKEAATKSGEFIRTAVMGTCGAQVGAAVLAGDPLTANAEGKLITAALGQYVFARALQAAAAADLYIEVQITREGDL